MSKNIRTLNDVSNNHAHDSGEDSDGGSNDGDRQGFFVGGSEHSGQQVLGPPRPGGAGPDIGELFNSARRHGAEVVSSDENAHSSSGPFASGGGVRLGVSSEANSQSKPATSTGTNTTSAGPAPVEIAVIFWANGFSIDDGPLRSFEDAANREFMTSIMQGQIPPELVAAHPRNRINVRMERRSTEYVAPKPKPFAGAGARLGTVVPNIAGLEPVSVPGPSASDAAEALKKAQEAAGVKSDEPTTQVQVRLPDGNRLVAKLNNTHTITQLRNFIVNARPDLAFAPFNLMTTFPNKVIDNENQSLQEGGLLNAVVVLKLSA